MTAAPSISRSRDPSAAADRLRELHTQLETAFADLVSSDDWARMLAVAARFHHYSPANVMLILHQRPDASRVAGYRAWQSVGRQVRRGEHGIAILAPCTYAGHHDDDEAEPGNEEPRRVLRGFKVAHVFDLAQTEGDPLPDVRPALLDGHAPAGLWEALAAQVTAAGFTLERGDCRPANGRTDYTIRTVTVRDDVSDAQAAKTLAHELAHVLLHDGTEYVLGCRGLVEVEAESVAYIVASASGLATDAYTVPYVAHWADGNSNAVKATAERVISTAHAILSAIDPVPDTATLT
ncbi:MAG TPA: ArdC-like ssDNA-binding domain-containing protein [Acidimicrobiales bacterium]|nr:ArdC-like ssDNA-binding domain-containing protein [Acidimicrobiales bacterium]